MSSRPSNSGPRRRRRGGRSGGSSHSRSNDSFHVRREARKPAGFWDKVKAFFGLTPAPQQQPASNGRRSRPAADAPVTASRQQDEAPRSRAPREARKPEAVEVTTPRLYIGNLSYDAAESDLFELFSGVGSVVNVEIIANKHTQRSKGFGFVQMTSVTEAKRAVDELHDKDYMGRKLVVSGAKLPADRPIGAERTEAPADSGDDASQQTEPASQA